MATTSDSKSFFAALFDFSFTTFITLKFLKVIYAIVMVAIGITAFAIFVRMAAGGAAGVIGGLIVAPLFALIYLIVARVYLEALALFFRIGDNTQAIRQAIGGNGGGFVPPQGPPPGGPAPDAGPFGQYQPPNQGGAGQGGYPPPQTGFPPQV